MFRTEVLNRLITAFHYRAYLEIDQKGCRDFDAIECSGKVGVGHGSRYAAYTNGKKLVMDDPRILAVKTDDFFNEMLSPNVAFDIVFVDGDHEYEQARRDIANSLQHLAPGGCLVVHDVLPPDNQRIEPYRPPRAGIWYGESWRAYLELLTRVPWFRFALDTDDSFGCIWPSMPTLKPLTLEKSVTDVAFEELQVNAKEWLRLRSVEMFKAWLERPNFES